MSEGSVVANAKSEIQESNRKLSIELQKEYIRGTPHVLSQLIFANRRNWIP